VVMAKGFSFSGTIFWTSRAGRGGEGVASFASLGLLEVHPWSSDVEKHPPNESQPLYDYSVPGIELLVWNEIMQAGSGGLLDVSWRINR